MSYSRASIGKGSLGRFSLATDISASSAATRHWVNSVSDIYGPDEIEDLLADLNRLELATLEHDDYRYNSCSEVRWIYRCVAYYRISMS